MFRGSHEAVERLAPKFASDRRQHRILHFGDPLISQEFCEELAWRLAPLVLARKFVIRISSEVHCRDHQELEHTRLALQAAAQVRSKIIQSMAPAMRQTAARRLYCFCRRSTDGTAGGAESRQVRVDILLTKPDVKHIDPRESQGSEQKIAEQ